MSADVRSGHLGRLSIVACESGRLFARRVEATLIDVIEAEDGVAHSVIRRSGEVTFANGEVKTVIEENIQGDDVYLFQCVDDPRSKKTINDNLMAFVTPVNAVYQSDPDRITAVIPQFPYARQERKKARESITARLVASLLESAGADRVITLDIHAEAIEGFFQRAVLEDLHASKAIVDFFRDVISRDDLCIVAPDTGGAEMARHHSYQFDCPFAIVDKARDYSQASVVEHAPRRRRGGEEGPPARRSDRDRRHGDQRVQAPQGARRHGDLRRLLAPVLQR